MNPKTDTAITDEFWRDNYMGDDGVCVLCANTAKVEGGFCICPDGRALEKNAAEWRRLITRRPPGFIRRYPLE